MSEKITVLVPEKEVDERIEFLGKQISKDYEGRQVHLICILKGGAFFMCELAKRITVPVSIDYMSVSSYGNRTSSSGVVRIAKDLDESIEGKDVLIVEDIIDSGNTLCYVKNLLKERGCKSTKLCTLFDKPSRREAPVYADYIGYEVANEFIVGYGLDFNERYRNLPYVGVLKPEAYQL